MTTNDQLFVRQINKLTDLRQKACIRIIHTEKIIYILFLKVDFFFQFDAMMQIDIITG